ncbi:hypothetical protein POTOM_037667 [Populus tomentosa]|uniref:Uncharacterized protein n=1 Tax=Populus tomentosa TaxID=118781 RepID=A0A8X8CKN9_POPTO|nr:hypothetical protein POTOM_037667 [Populus tomentosa]
MHCLSCFSKKKQVATVEREVDGDLVTLYLDLPAVITRGVKVTATPKRKAWVIVSSVDELIDTLINAAHVI